MDNYHLISVLSNAWREREKERKQSNNNYLNSWRKISYSPTMSVAFKLCYSKKTKCVIASNLVIL